MSGLSVVLFWVFQVINGLMSFSMFAAPRRFHESLVPNPENTYREIGFSPTAVEMVHNVIRGQGAALLAITLYLAFKGAGEKDSFLLIAIACGLTALAHVATLRHHLKSPVVRPVVGKMGAMYFAIALNIAMMAGAIAALV